EVGSKKPLVIFNRSTCCMPHTIETLIRNFGANPTIYELHRLQNGRELERALIELGFQPSFPAVFIGNELVGGSNEIMSLNIRGKLKQLLNRA
ncbi:monothiol glutaredoxin-s1, partial [Nicotiana attenuata]